MPPLATQFLSTDRLESYASTTPLHTKADKHHINQSTSAVALQYWCHSLHAVLFILQVILLGMLWNHPERNITIAFDNSALTIGLSAFLQAFYTLYAAFLVFLTQRLALIKFLSRPQKLTAIHDVSAAWAGLGAATTVLWRQTNTTASSGTTFLIFAYLLCVSILHVASPTVFEFEPYTAIMATDIPANSTWPNASDLSSPGSTMTTAGSLLPFMSILSGLSTDGLSDSTLYDTFNGTSQMVNASVNAHTILADCGLLQNLSYTFDGELVNVTASINGVYYQVYLPVSPTELTSNQLWFSSHLGSGPFFYGVSAAMKLNDTVGHNSSLDIVWDTISNGNTSTTIYIVACSLEVSNYTSNLDVQSGNLESPIEQPDAPSQAWSLWTSNENSLETQLNLMVSQTYVLVGYGDCTNFCSQNHTLDLHMMLLLGIRQWDSLGPDIASATITPYQFEKALSQMTAQLIWIAGQLGGEHGGFSPSQSLTRVTEQVSRWRLNINAVSVFFTLSMSFILMAMSSLMLGHPSNIEKDPPLVKGTTVLETLWAGAHSSALRKRLNAAGHPLSKELRSVGMFQVWLTKSGLVQENRAVNDEISPLIPELGGGVDFKSDDAMHGITESLQIVGWRVSVLSLVKSRHLWCYFFHGLFFLLHVMLLLLLICHPEHGVVIQSTSKVSTTALAALLQFFYVMYTLMLVFLTQQLAVSRAVAHAQSITSMHDISQAWTGIGSALVGVWQQVKVPVSLRTTLTVTTYYLCISVLHIASTTVMQFELFDSSMHHTAQSLLAWPALGLGAYDWSTLSPVVPLNQLPNFHIKGLMNRTVYDVPKADLTSVNATVNATTIHANCGLLTATPTDYPGVVNTTVPTLGPVVVSLPEVWKDTIVFLGTNVLHNGSNKSLPCSTCASYLMYWVTTTLAVDASLSENVNMSTSWLYTPPEGNEISSNTTGYLVACSLNATTTVDVLDVQHGLLTSTPAQSADASQGIWSLWSPIGSMPSLGNEISTALSYASLFASNNSTPMIYGASFTTVDVYTMSLFGINFTENSAASVTQSSADPSVTLGPSQFEDAISQVAAQYIWAAGHTNGDFGPTFGSGESVMTDVVVLRRLNVNTIPVVIASVASLVLLVLAAYMVGHGSESTPLIELGVLETLWLEAHSDALHASMRQVADPTVHNLRVAGMSMVGLADEVRGVLDGRPGVSLESLNEGDFSLGSSASLRAS